MGDFDLSGFLSDDTFVVTGVPSDKYPAGQRYAIKSPSARDGLLLKKIFNASSGDGKPAITPELIEYCRDADGNEIGFDEKLLGDALDQMLEDGVSSVRLDMISEVVYVRFASSQELAEMIVEAAGKAQAASPAAPAKPTSTGRTPRAKAGSSSKRASTATVRTSKAAPSSRSSKSTPRKAAAKKTA